MVDIVLLRKSFWLMKKLR